MEIIKLLTKNKPLDNIKIIDFLRENPIPDIK